MYTNVLEHTITHIIFMRPVPKLSKCPQRIRTLEKRPKSVPEEYTGHIYIYRYTYIYTYI